MEKDKIICQWIILWLCANKEMFLSCFTSVQKIWGGFVLLQEKQALFKDYDCDRFRAR